VLCSPSPPMSDQVGSSTEPGDPPDLWALASSLALLILWTWLSASSKDDLPAPLLHESAAEDAAGTGSSSAKESLLLKLLELEIEQLRQEIEQRRQERALRSVHVHRWDSPVSSMVKLSLSFEHFFVEALAAVKITGAARLYMIRDENWAVRQPLSAASYEAFLQQSRDFSSMLPDIYVFEQLPSGNTSLLGPPAGQAEESASEDSGEEEHPGDGASQACSSSMEADFRRGVTLRDGPLCVLCCSREPPLEAAHIIAHTAEQPELLAAGLLCPNVPNNGIMLCIPCHRLHDSFMWCFDPSKGVVVADALLHDEGLGSEWRRRVGAQLSQPAAGTALAAWWPPASVWAAGVGRFEAARAESLAKADKKPFFCGMCLKRYVKADGVLNHQCGRGQMGQLSTPASERSGSEEGSRASAAEP
jgi:hypothetical protein